MRVDKKYILIVIDIKLWHEDTPFTYMHPHNLPEIIKKTILKRLM